MMNNVAQQQELTRVASGYRVYVQEIKTLQQNSNKREVDVYLKMLDEHENTKKLRNLLFQLRQ